MGVHSSTAKSVPPIGELSALPTPLNPGEKATVEALSSLGPDWRIFVQPRLSSAQPDFVVCHPDRGVWIIEVKDWNPEHYRPHGRPGSQRVEVFNGVHWVELLAPRVQIAAYCDIFHDRFFALNESVSTRSPLRVLLVVPQFSKEQGEKVFGSYQVVTADEIQCLASRLEEAEGIPVPDEQWTELMYWLDEPEFVGDQRLPLALSRNAKEVADNPREVQTRRVRGPAGSGKSLALASRAIVLAEQGKSVLVVTYNITLFHYLHDLCSRASRDRGVRYWKRAVSFVHFHGLVRELWIQRGKPAVGDDNWTIGTIRLLAQHYKYPGNGLPTFDAILVDEGQDFELEWWQFLRSHLLKPGGEMLLVADRTQNLYEQPSWTEEAMSGAGFAGRWFTLEGTYRMPVDLIPIAAEFGTNFLPELDRQLPETKSDHPAAFEAHEPTVRKWVNVTRHEIVQRAADEVEVLFRNDSRLSPSDIVVLADHGVGGQIIDELVRRGNDAVAIFTPSAGDHRQSRKRGFWAGRPGIKGCTVQSFKGWETRAVVCVPTSKPEVSLYVAMTRVKAAPARSAFITVVNSVSTLRPFKERFERSISSSEVPALRGQRALDV